MKPSHRCKTHAFLPEQFLSIIFYYNMTVPTQDYFIVAHCSVPNPGLSSDLTFSFVVFAYNLERFIVTRKSLSLPGLGTV
jgi:hypothetical protein